MPVSLSSLGASMGCEMYLRRCWSVFSVAVMISLAFMNSAWAEPTVVTLAAEDGWAPYSNADGSGMSNELVIAAYRAVGIEVKLQVRPYARVLAEVEAGQWIGGFNVSREHSTEQRFLWGEQPLLMSRWVYYQAAARPLQAKSQAELRNGERIGCIIGYEYGDGFASNTRIQKQCVNSHEQNIQKLLAGRLDAMLFAEKTGRKVLHEKKLAEQIKPAFIASELPAYVAFSRQHAQADYFRKKLDEGLTIIRANGEYALIENRY